MAATAFATEALRIHELGHLSDAQIAEATRAAPSTVRGWFAGRSSPTGQRAERVAELAEIVDRLTRVVERLDRLRHPDGDVLGMDDAG